MFIHLTTHSAFSLQEGLLQPAELAGAAQANEMPALGLTDHRLLSASVEFVIACRQEGVQPLLGLEIDLETGRLALLATSLEGWSNLCRLSSALALSPEPEAACPISLLSAHSRDLIALSGEQGDPTGGRLQQLKEVFKDRLYVNIQEPAAGVHLAILAHKLSLPSVISHPVYTLTPEQATLQTTLAAIRLNQPLGRIPPSSAAPAGAYFVSREEMEARYKDFPAPLAATEEIAARCKFDLPLGIARMPTVPLPPGLTSAQYLRQKAEAGARELYGKIGGEVRARLDHELEVIARMGFEPIFLIVEELLDFARRSGVPFSSRFGSLLARGTLPGHHQPGSAAPGPVF